MLTLVLSLLLALAPQLSLADTPPLPGQAGAEDGMPCHETGPLPPGLRYLRDARIVPKVRRPHSVIVAAARDRPGPPFFV